MNKPVFILLLLLIPSIEAASVKFSFESDVFERSVLAIYGAADYPEIAPIINAFQRKYPTIKVVYTEWSTNALYDAFLENEVAHPDIMLSSAMDLQFKLVNDGHAISHTSTETERLPNGASWRNQIFGFTSEPAVFAFNTDVLGDQDIPHTRTQLVQFIQQNSHQLNNKIGNFDIENTGIGYLVLGHDRLQTNSYYRLLEVLGKTNARSFTSSSSMLKALSTGELLLAYNINGSYANTWSKSYPKIKVVIPKDYTTVFMRSAFIPKKAQNVFDAKRFIDFILSDEGQLALSSETSFNPIRQELITEEKRVFIGSSSSLRPIPLDLSLLIFTDKMKREVILNEWEYFMKDFD
ncbi:ABC transporter substrate-binding protein [Marinomonas sp. 15G1-11]|uniref:ABC transporter substrate-binding protein n=1 Tax=Marinomonas phaeophyticola TaxID=3004091 RepID=A0ABT4JVM5_9GAMM|nr:ABC transporter substrate-binding protein [Marinomonas sp. 15G1-11]MCZ2722439.1 ABC transporter substrate-binding protein [Marinomonas sp. 15G1-11]